MDEATAIEPTDILADNRATGLQVAKGVLWDFIVSQESAKLSLDPKDHGNWTSGIIGIGQLKGSKYGISAAAFPLLDIAEMTALTARSMCLSHYWPAVEGDTIALDHSVALAMMMTDVAWSSGPDTAIKILQTSIGVTADGDIGTATTAALKHTLSAPAHWNLPTAEADLLAEYAAQRILFESKIGTWDRYAGGWVRRVTRIQALVYPFQQRTILT
jgi:lysozyme family protein